jgi:Ca2+-binding RTX toxin-like protein
LVFTPSTSTLATASTSFTFSVRDVGGLYDSTPNTLTIASVQYTGVTIVGSILRFGGGAGADNVSVSGGNIVVNGVPYALAGISEVRIWARGGDDTIDLTGLAVRSFVDGGQGNDIFTGGSADDVIFGGAGDDTITGAAGNDFLIGGTGKDRIVGSAGHDILVSGDVAANLDLSALRAISQAWAASRTVDEQTVDEILDETVVNGDSDMLTGSSGADLFIINSGDKITDFNFTNPNTNKDGDVVVIIT